MTQAKAFRPAKIMVPVDFSASSKAALAAAKELAAQFDSELFLLHVIPMLPNMACDAYNPEETFLAEAKEQAEARLGAAASELKAEGRPARFAVEIGNDIVGNIVHVLQREKADLLVFSTHGMSGWRPAVFGSIAGQVMKLAQCPVLLLPSSKESVKESAEWRPEGVSFAPGEPVAA